MQDVNRGWPSGIVDAAEKGTPVNMFRGKRDETPTERDGFVVSHRDVEVAVDPVRLQGDLAIPGDPAGIVIFAHGSGSSRHSPRNVAVAKALNRSGLATLLFDLLMPAEGDDRSRVFDVELLAGRLQAVTSWVGTRPDCRRLPVAYFGASTGAAAALIAAARLPSEVSAIVCRGGRPDLAGAALERVSVPTLLVVGGKDHDVLELNRQAERRLRCEHRLVVVPAATHLFEEPGALERVQTLAAEWLAKHLGQSRPGEGLRLARAGKACSAT